MHNKFLLVDNLYAGMWEEAWLYKQQKYHNYTSICQIRSNYLISYTQDFADDGFEALVNYDAHLLNNSQYN